MRLIPAVVVTSLLLTGAGCFRTESQLTVLPDQPARESVNLPGEIDIQSAQIKKDFTLNEFASCTISITYPVFPSGDLPEKVALQTDHELSHFIASALGYTAEIDGTYKLEELADDYLANCQTEITDEYSNLSSNGEELFTNLKRTVEIVYNVKLNEYHLVSIGLDEYSYTGGAHPNQNMMYLNIDRGGDRLLVLGDIIDAEHLKSFNQFEKSKLLVDNRDSLYPEITTEYEVLIADQTQLTAEQQLAAYGSFKNFYLTPTSIITYYNGYDIAPYAAGPIFVEIPYSDILESISLNGPLVPIVEKL